MLFDLCEVRFCIIASYNIEDYRLLSVLDLHWHGRILLRKEL